MVEPQGDNRMQKLIKLPKQVWERMKPSRSKRVDCPACGRFVSPEDIIEENGYIGCKYCIP